LEDRAWGSDQLTDQVIEVLTDINDRPLPSGDKKRSWLIHLIRNSLTSVFNACPRLNENSAGGYRYIDWTTRSQLRAPQGKERILVLNAAGFPPEGPDCDARLICKAKEYGWRQFIGYGYQGQRFCGCGLGQDTTGIRIDVYGSSGDYLASGIDGLEMVVHGNAQDQVGQIMKQGKLVIYGDVGQTLLYGAKGGHIFVMGNTAGRPLINAVGRPRVVINGTCLDYLAESFMAGDPLNGGGFVIVNGIEFDYCGNVISQDTPYPGANLFSLASGGAIYLRDPHHKIVSDQLNGGEFAPMTPADWELILPILQENQRLFGVSVDDDLLTVDGEKRDYTAVYRKVRAVKLEVLTSIDDE